MISLNWFEEDVQRQKTFAKKDAWRWDAFVERRLSHEIHTVFNATHVKTAEVSEHHVAPFGFVRNRCGVDVPEDVCVMLDTSYLAVCLS